ncbi:shikimate dehydrogenase [Thalassoroseus pseudoceratinae]|uniref:shikimate dehydrogenase n=1 Tax=Thalassoroseus pseudoceratinae TaxID=2713176 RepID=UPI00141D7548|nr:shikimate dehydrogenase [Thalassoroseus pseudoceratinae]
MICVSIGRSRHERMIDEHKLLAKQGAELVEFRVDWLGRSPDVVKLLNERPTPCVITCRRPEDRGRWRGTEEQRLTILRSAIVAEADYVDLEEDIADDIKRYGPTKRIVSYHNFDETPDDLEDIHERLCGKDPDIVKIVTTANAHADIVRMMKLVQQSKVPTVGFCMGEIGIPSRILCGKYGSPFTYATFSKERQLAPGQLSFEDMHLGYRYKQIGPSTQVFGVVGDPIAHSLSPQIHNAAFQKDGFDGVYVPFRIFKGELEKSLKALEWLDIQGLSVTIPHKQATVKIAKHFEDSVKEIGAANTLYRSDQQEWHAANTDYDAALKCMLSGFKRRGDAEPSLVGRDVLMLGAGGVGRAVGKAVIKNGGRLTITNRSPKKAEELAAELGCKTVPWTDRGDVDYELLVNCTSVGMHPDVDVAPFAEDCFIENTVVFDTVYTPENTLFLKRARKRGCHVVAGTEMFVRQAAVQYERFTQRTAPVETMLKTLRRIISPVHIS